MRKYSCNGFYPIFTILYIAVYLNITQSHSSVLQQPVIKISIYKCKEGRNSQKKAFTTECKGL